MGGEILSQWKVYRIWKRKWITGIPPDYDLNHTFLYHKQSINFFYDDIFLVHNMNPTFSHNILVFTRGNRVGLNFCGITYQIIQILNLY